MIGRKNFDRTVAAVRDSGAGQLVEDLLRSPLGGRQRALDADVFLAGLVLTAGNGKPLTLINVHATLTTEIAYSAQSAYGISYRRKGEDRARPITLRQVRYLLEAIEKKLAHTEGRAPGLTEEDRIGRSFVLQDLLDRMVGASLPSHLPLPETLALDATSVDSWGRGKRRTVIRRDGEAADEDSAEQRRAEDTADGTTESYSFDPDADWGYRTRTYDNRTTKCFGYDVFAMVGVPAVGAPTELFPKLIRGFAIRPAGSDVVEPSMRVLQRLLDAGEPVSELLDDRAFSYKRPERWADPLRELGVKQVFDLHPHDRGVRHHDGIRLIDGTPHCPATPDRLVDIARPANLSVPELKKNATAAEKAWHDNAKRQLEEFAEQIAERETYAFVRIKVKAPENAKDQGKTRWICPAQAGKVRCANCPLSVDMPMDLPEIANPPAKSTAPKCCNQVTVTIPGAAMAKLAQEHYWGSPEWIASYIRRTYVEGYFGNLKNPSTGNVRRGWCQVVGLVKTSIMVAGAITATNIGLLRSWAKQTGDITNPLSEPLGAPPSFEEIDPDQLAAPAHGPPVAA